MNPTKRKVRDVRELPVWKLAEAVEIAEQMKDTRSYYEIVNLLEELRRVLVEDSNDQ